MDPEDPGRFPKWAPIFSLIVFLPLLALYAELFHTVSKKSLPKVFILNYARNMWGWGQFGPPER